MIKTAITAIAAGLLFSAPALADRHADKAGLQGGVHLDLDAVPKAASARTVGARGFVTTNSPMYGSFELATAATVFILVRGNSLGTLNITQAYLDFPRAIIYDGANNPIFVDGAGYPGFNSCLQTVATDKPVRDYYAARGAPISDDDACLAGNFPAGVYTFRVVPSVAGSTSAFNSVPPAGEVLFEVKLGP